MGIRQTINEKPGAAAAVTAAIIIVAAALIVWQWNSGSSRRTVRVDLSKAFYSDDDGKTFFEDDAKKVTPFDHGGKPAVRAHVYECGSTKFVGYLERYTAEGKKKVEGGEVIRLSSRPFVGKKPLIEVKKPGVAGWIPVDQNLEKWSAIRDVRCPDNNSQMALEIGPTS